MEQYPAQPALINRPPEVDVVALVGQHPDATVGELVRYTDAATGTGYQREATRLQLLRALHVAKEAGQLKLGPCRPCQERGAMMRTWRLARQVTRQPLGGLRALEDLLDWAMSDCRAQEAAA